MDFWIETKDPRSSSRLWLGATSWQGQRVEEQP